MQQNDFNFKLYDDGTDFESFSVKGNNKGSEKNEIKTINTPLRAYKCLLMNLHIPLKIEKMLVDKKLCKFMLEKLNESKAKYLEFLSTGFSMTIEECKYVRSAYASLQLVEFWLFFQEPDRKMSKFDFLKFKEICSDMMQSYNAAGAESFQYLLSIYSVLLHDHYLHTAQFVLYVMMEILEMTSNDGVKEGNLVQMLAFMFLIERLKVDFFSRVLTHATNMHTTGRDVFEIPKDDKKKGKVLMELFENFDCCQCYKFSVNIKNYNEAEVLHRLILENAVEMKDKDPLNFAHYVGLANGNLAAFATDPDEVYELSSASYDLLEGARKQKYENSSHK